MKIYNVIAIPAISLSALLIQATALLAQAPAVNGHKKATTANSRQKPGKPTTPASTAAASTPAATGSGPSSSDIHARVAVPSGNHSSSARTAAAGTNKPVSSSANKPNMLSKQPRAIKTVPSPAATGSGPSSSDIHTTTKPAAVPAVKTKSVRKKN